MLHDRLPTGRRLRWLGPGVARCPHGCEATEGVLHLFVGCAVARAAWRAAPDWWQERAGARWVLSSHLVAFGAPPAFNSAAAHGCTTRRIWNVRCRRVFDGDCTPAAEAFRAWVDGAVAAPPAG